MPFYHGGSSWCCEKETVAQALKLSVVLLML
jgi:hypothetical protein